MVEFSRNCPSGAGPSPRVATYYRRTKNEKQCKNNRTCNSRGDFPICSSLRLRGGRSEWATTTSHAFAELFTLLWGHALPALLHAVTPVHAPAGTAAKSTEEDLAQKQQAHRLPEGD